MRTSILVMFIRYYRTENSSYQHKTLMSVKDINEAQTIIKALSTLEYNNDRAEIHYRAECMVSVYTGAGPILLPLNEFDHVIHELQKLSKQLIVGNT